MDERPECCSCIDMHVRDTPVLRLTDALSLVCLHMREATSVQVSRRESSCAVLHSAALKSLICWDSYSTAPPKVAT